MTAQFILERYKDFHERTMPSFLAKVGNYKETENKIYNPIKWIIWHMVRGEDFGLNRVLRDSTQIYFSKNWDKKLNVNTPSLGTGMTKDQVYVLNDLVDIKTLDEYRKDVYKAYAEAIQNLDLSVLNNKLSADYLKKILFNEGSFEGNIDLIYDLYIDKSIGWFLLHTTLTHNYYHLGQISNQLKH